MKKKLSLKKFEIISAIVVILLGTLLHFTFNWSNNNSIVALFSSVNESVWEHLKILFFPMILTTVIGYFYYHNIPNYICNKLKGIILAMSIIIIFYYTYSGILGTHFPIIDISLYIIAVIIGEIYSYKLIIKNKECNNLVAFIFIIILTCCFFIFTFNAPHIGIFKDPSTNLYGLTNKRLS